MGPEHELLERLINRDNLEKKDSQYHEAFAELSRRLGDKANVEGDKDHRDDAAVIKNLNQLTISNEKLEVKVNQLSQKNSQLEAKIKSLNNKINNLSLEIQEKNKSIEIINDENLINQIQNNVLHDRIDKLTLENTELIERWMRKVRQDAEKLNDANEFLQEVKKRSDE